MFELRGPGALTKLDPPSPSRNWFMSLIVLVMTLASTILSNSSEATPNNPLGSASPLRAAFWARRISAVSCSCFLTSARDPTALPKVCRPCNSWLFSTDLLAGPCTLTSVVGLVRDVFKGSSVKRFSEDGIIVL